MTHILVAILTFGLIKLKWEWVDSLAPMTIFSLNGETDLEIYNLLLSNTNSDLTSRYLAMWY